jgi:hypothetical protein
MSNPVDCCATLEETGPFRRVWRLSGISSATVEWRMDRRGPAGIFGAERVLVNGIVVYREPRLLGREAAGLIYFDLPSSEGVLPTRIERCLCPDGVTALSLSITKMPLHVEGDPELLYAPLAGYPVPASAPEPAAADLPRPAAAASSDSQSRPIPSDEGSSQGHMALRGPRGCEVAIEVLSCSREGWLDCQLAVTLAGFSARYPATLDLDSLVQFHRELSAVYETLTGTATFRPLEDQLSLEVGMTQTGHARVRGAARQWSPDATLTFEFETDQSYLGPACRELADLLEAVRAASSA